MEKQKKYLKIQNLTRDHTKDNIYLRTILHFITSTLKYIGHDLCYNFNLYKLQN